MPLQAEERLFLEAIRDLNRQVGKLQEEERDGPIDLTDGAAQKASMNPTKSDTGEMVNTAAALAMEAALKLNTNVSSSSLHPSSTSLHSVVSWTKEASSTAPHIVSDGSGQLSVTDLVHPAARRSESPKSTVGEVPAIELAKNDHDLNAENAFFKKRPISVVE